MSVLPSKASERKNLPIYSGVLKYFPRAVAYVAHVSKVGNDQHNPNQPLHWAREKSTDHHDCLIRHAMEAGRVDSDGVLHSGKAAWRALAALEVELERASQEPQFRFENDTFVKDGCPTPPPMPEAFQAGMAHAKKYPAPRITRPEGLFIYVSGPFSPRGEIPLSDDEQKVRNISNAILVSRSLANLGHKPHCPHAATGCLDGILDYEDFMELDLALLRSGAFDALFYMGSSPGADRELAVAESMGLQIFHSLDEVPNARS